MSMRYNSMIMLESHIYIEREKEEHKLEIDERKKRISNYMTVISKLSALCYLHFFE